LHKSNKVTGVDATTELVVELFHPLRMPWADHFELTDVAECVGLTPFGRATVAALHMNDELPRIARFHQIRLGLLLKDGTAIRPR
jgi:hypothetical protein